MKLEYSQVIHTHVRLLAKLRSSNRSGLTVEEEGPPRLHPELKLADIKGLEHLFQTFTYANTDHNLIGCLGECYRYAYKAARSDFNLIYCEGLATSKGVGIPLSHAWCVHKDTGEVYDPVWRDEHEGNGYCGVPLNLRFVKAFIRKSKSFGIYEGLWMHREFLNLPLKDVVHQCYHALVFGNAVSA